MARQVHLRLLVADLVDDLVAVAVAGDCVERQGEGLDKAWLDALPPFYMEL